MSENSRTISEHVALACCGRLPPGCRWSRISCCYLLFLCPCSVLGVPLSWRKTAGGDTVSWVGFELLHRSYKIGLSQRRAQWFQRWTRETAESGCVHMSAFEEGIGRVMYVAGASEFDRTFLSPLYRFLTLHPRNSVRRLPGCVVFVLRYLADQIQESRHYDCAAELIYSDSCSSFRYIWDLWRHKVVLCTGTIHVLGGGLSIDVLLGEALCYDRSMILCMESYTSLCQMERMGLLPSSHLKI